jgi:hypothetical protein
MLGTDEKHGRKISKKNSVSLMCELLHEADYHFVEQWPFGDLEVVHFFSAAVFGAVVQCFISSAFRRY